jgi:hypothetical protein
VVVRTHSEMTLRSSQIAGRARVSAMLKGQGN